MARFVRGEQSIELSRQGRSLFERGDYGEVSDERHDERAAAIAFFVRVHELLAGGWKRTSDFVADLVVVPEPELVKQIDAGDRDALAVYTDWLIERGDPRGELAALRRTDDRAKIASLEKTRGLELYGPLAFAPRAWHDRYAYVWRDGWVDEIHFAEDLAMPRERELVLHVVHAPMARFARTFVNRPA